MNCEPGAASWTSDVSSHHAGAHDMAKRHMRYARHCDAYIARASLSQEPVDRSAFTWVRMVLRFLGVCRSWLRATQENPALAGGMCTCTCSSVTIVSVQFIRVSSVYERTSAFIHTYYMTADHHALNELMSASRRASEPGHVVLAESAGGPGGCAAAALRPLLESARMKLHRVRFVL